MKIEMGESLFYSWLRHVKECQVVQMNWKPSPSWQLMVEEELKQFMDITNEYFQDKYGYNIYGNNSISQLLKQAEVDALGISKSKNEVTIYAIDVAFHESGLNYGGQRETVMRVIKKLIRTALCMKGYFGKVNVELIFASPKIYSAVLGELESCIADLNFLFHKNDYQFTARVIANDDFNNQVLKPILIASDGVSDTSELFMRGFQLVKMFGDRQQTPVEQSQKPLGLDDVTDDTISELKIGKIANTFLRGALESGKASNEEVSMMLTKDYSKNIFGIDFPLLVLANEECDSVRYYAKPLLIRGIQYCLCSQWFEGSANNDRPLLLAWLETHVTIEL